MNSFVRAVHETKMKQTRWLLCAVLSANVLFSSAQGLCQSANCPSDTYCNQKADNSTDCIYCDSSCSGCIGSGAENCKQCKPGFVIPQGQSQCLPCVTGRFGVNCASTCHCLNNESCNKTNGNCGNWKCDRGYQGLPQCQELCTTGMFGLDCLLTCHCPDNDNCSNINGDCSSGRCHPEWGSAGCQKRLPKLALPPTLVETKCNNITLKWDAFNEANDIGDVPVGEYRLYKIINQTNPSTNNQWQLVANVSAASGQSQYVYSVTTGLNPDQWYNFRVDAVGMEFGKLLSQISMGTITDRILNLCTITTTPNPANTTKPVLSRKVFDQINITASNSSLIRIVVVVLPEFKGYDYNVTLTKQLLGTGDCDNTEGKVQEHGSMNMLSFPVALTDLASWSTYRISVTANAVGADVRETYTQNVTTLVSTPTGTVTNLKLNRVTRTEAEVSWGPVLCNQRNGPLSSYDVLLTRNDNSNATQLHYVTQDTRFGLVNLTSYKNYAVQIRYTNPAGAGPATQALNFTTLEAVPGPVEITQLTPTYSTIAVSFQPPSLPNGVIISYTVTYAQNSDFNLSQSVTFTEAFAASENMSVTIERLDPEKVYYVEMAATTSVGTGPYGTSKLTKTLKAPPQGDTISISVGARTNSCLTLEWSASPNIADLITSYVLEVKKVAADTSIPVYRTELPSSNRAYQVCQLKASTLYSVNITGTNSSGVVMSVTENFSTDHGTPPVPAVPVFVNSTYTTITIAIEPVVSLDVPITAYQIQINKVLANGKRKRLAEIPGYVTAELSPADITHRREFVIGDGKFYGQYENKALEQDSYYMIYYIVLSSLNNNVTASWSQMKTALHAVPYDPSKPVWISLANKNFTCLNLTWTLPTGVENIMTGIVFSIKKTNDGSSVSTADLPRLTVSHTECNLTPFTYYTVGILIKTDSGTLTTASETFTTDWNTPPAPAAPVFVKSTNSSITIAIEPLVLTDAPLTSYQLQVEMISSRRRKRIAGVPGYVTAQLTKDNVTQKMNFVVGDGRNYSGYWNMPLQRNTLYTVHYVVVSSVGNDTKYSFSSLNPPVRTVPYDPSASVNDNSTEILIGVIVALGLLVLLILLLLLLYWCWRNRNRFIPYVIQENDKNELALPELKDDYDPEKYWNTIYNIKDHRYIVAGRDLVYKEKNQPYFKDTSMQHSDLPKVSFHDEFHNLPHNSRKATNDLAQESKELNRFPHLLPYDHSLVKLKPDSSSQGFYINASFIPGYKRTPAYIAAQSPFDETTVLDFWRLIYQKSIKTVVMITNLVEDNIVKCTKYWPEDMKASYGDFLLHLIEVTEYADYVVRTVQVMTSREELSKTVTIFEFTSWPDHGVPDDPIPLLEMRYRMRSHHGNESSPILVHCGTGMGRTGVFIAVDALIEQYTAEGRVMVFDFVKRIRKDRPFMVRTLKQYVFIYEVLFEEFHAGRTRVSFSLKDQYHNWTQKNPRTNNTYLRDQYQLLETFTRRPKKDEFKTALLEVNLHKNRYLDVVPPDKYRPLLRSKGGLTDYINALFLDSYLMKNQFIITQTPLRATIVDFWKLVYDYDVRTIAMVENFKNEDDSCFEYWAKTNLKDLQPFIIEATVAYQHENITIRDFKISSSLHPGQPVRLVKQFQFNAWAQNSLTPQSKTMMMDLIDSVLDWQDKVCQNEKPMIVHCQDGSSHSGLFAILALLCEKMEKDKEVDVYKTIKHCKSRRTQFISDYEQFRFCYKTIWDYMNLRMPGGTFTESLGQNKNDQLYGVGSLSLTSYFDKISDEGSIDI